MGPHVDNSNDAITEDAHTDSAQTVAHTDNSNDEITEDAHTDSAPTVVHADNSNDEVEHATAPINHEVIFDPVHTNAPNEHVVMVDPNLNLDEQLSAYQKNEDLELSQLGFFNAVFGLYLREEDCQKHTLRQLTPRNQKNTLRQLTPRNQKNTLRQLTPRNQKNTMRQLTPRKMNM